MSAMNTQHVAVQSGRVTAEGDDLYYEVRGQGPPLLLIAPAGGMGGCMHSLRIFSRMNSKSLPTIAVPMLAAP